MEMGGKMNSIPLHFARGSHLPSDGIITSDVDIACDINITCDVYP